MCVLNRTYAPILKCVELYVMQSVKCVTIKRYYAGFGWSRALLYVQFTGTVHYIQEFYRRFESFLPATMHPLIGQ